MPQPSGFGVVGSDETLGTNIHMKKHGKIGIIYNGRTPEAKAMTSALTERLGLRDRAWVLSTSELDSSSPVAEDTELIITVGGDGTIIRASRLSVPRGIPILGINMGRLGFMTELRAEDALDKVPYYLEGTARVEARSMLHVDYIPAGERNGQEEDSGGKGVRYHALNDAVVGRGAIARLVNIKAFIDGAHLTDFRADAVIASTATGSTGYNLSVGGPILPPKAEEIILKAVAPHVGIAPAVVLPANSVVELVVETDHPAILSVDGYMDRELSFGDAIRVQTSGHKTHFLRAHPETYFYETLTQRLGFGGGQSSTRAIQY